MRKPLYLVLMGALSLSACKKSASVEPPAAQAKAAKESQAAQALTALSGPPELLLFGGAEAFNGAMAALNTLVNEVTPAPPFSGFAGAQLQNEYSFKSVKGFDLNKSVKFAIFNRKVYRKNPLVLCIGVADKEVVKAAIPKTGQAADVEGNALSYLKSERSKRPIYLNFIDEHVCITRDVAIYPKNQEFIAKLLKTPIPHQGMVFFELENLLAAYGAEFEGGLKQVEQMMQMGIAASQVSNAAQTGALFTQLLQRVRVGARSLKRAQVALKLGADGARVDLKLTPKADGAADAVFKALASTGDHRLLDRLPTDTPLFASLKIDAAKADQLLADWTTLSLAPVFGDKPVDPKYAQAISAYIKALGGEMLMGMRPEGKSLGMVALFEVKDASAARAAQTTLMSMYTDPALQAYYTQMKMSVAHQAAAYQVAGVDVDVVKTEVTGLPPEAQAMIGLMGEMMTQNIALGEKLGVISYGAEGKAQIEGYLKGTIKGGLKATPGATHALKYAADAAFGVFYINPIDLARRLELGGMNPIAPALKGVESTHGLTLSAGVSGGDLQIVIDVPTTLLKQGKAAFDKAKGSF